MAQFVSRLECEQKLTETDARLSTIEDTLNKVTAEIFGDMLTERPSLRADVMQRLEQNRQEILNIKRHVGYPLVVGLIVLTVSIWLNNFH